MVKQDHPIRGPSLQDVFGGAANSGFVAATEEGPRVRPGYGVAEFRSGLADRLGNVRVPCVANGAIIGVSVDSGSYGSRRHGGSNPL